MKKSVFTFLLILLSLLMLFPSCGERGNSEGSSVLSDGGTIAPGNYLIDPMFDTDDFLPEYDTDNFFGSHRPWVRVGDTIIHALENGRTHFFNYYDCNSGESGVLCGKPDCTHSGDDCKTCDGFVLDIVGPDLSYYNGKLYWVGSPVDSKSDFYLMERDVTGANVRKVRRINREMMNGVVNPSFVVHRGYIYHTVVRFRFENGKEITTFVFSSSPINGKDDESFDEILCIDNEAYMPAYKLFYVGNYAYISVRYSNNYELYRFDSKTREVEKLLGPIPDFRATIWVSQKQEVYILETGKKHRALYRLENGELVLKLDIPQLNKITSTKIINGIVFVCTLDDGYKQYYDICTVEGKRIFNGMILPEEYQDLSAQELRRIHSTIYGCDENNLYIGYADDRNINSAKFLFVRYTFKDGKAEESIVWKGDQYYTGPTWW